MRHVLNFDAATDPKAAVRMPRAVWMILERSRAVQCRVVGDPAVAGLSKHLQTPVAPTIQHI
jgi:hypothetical protein